MFPLFWIPLLTLLIATASDAERTASDDAERKRIKQARRSWPGEALHQRTIFDFVLDKIPRFASEIKKLADHLSHVDPVDRQSGRRGGFVHAATFVARNRSYPENFLELVTTRERIPPTATPAMLAAEMGLEEEELFFYKTNEGLPSVEALELEYALAMAEPYRSVWRLDEEAWEALWNTEPPWEIIKDRLPAVPFPALLIVFPRGVNVPFRAQGAYDRHTNSVLLVEEIPGRRWRWIALDDFSDEPTLSSFAASRFDVSKGPTNEQILSYAESGNDAILRVLLNLFLALEHDVFEGASVKPDLPVAGHKRAKAERALQRQNRSPAAYTVIRLRPTVSRQRKTNDTPVGTKARHLVRGHWKHYWVLDPKNDIVYGKKERVPGKPAEGYLYLVARLIFPYWTGEGSAVAGPSRYLVKP